MKKINKFTKSNPATISSDEILFQGTIECLSEDCTNSTVTGVFESLGEISCYSYKQLNSLSNVNLACLSGQVGCDDKTLIKLFNLAFERICAMQNSITGLETATPGKIILDFCTAVNYSCSDTCLFPTPCCSADEGQFLNDIIQAMIGRTVRHSNQICEINETLQDLQDQIDELESGTGGGSYTPPKITFVCTSYWDGTAYIATPLVEFELDEAIEFLDVDLCKVKQQTGKYTDFTTMKNRTFIDPITGDPVFDFTTSTNQVLLDRQFQDYLFNLKLQVNAMQSKLDECCRTDCDKCMDNYFTDVQTNYGEVANGSSSTPYINISHVINTQALPSCLGNAVILSKSSYTVTDGLTTKVIALDELEGISVQSGTIDTTAILRFDLAELGMDYLRDIVIKLKVVTALDCVDNYRELIQRFDNPVCDQCMFCVKRILETDISNYSVSFDLTFSGGVYANETRHYILSTSNPCVSIERKVGQVIGLSNIINLNPSKVMFYSDCAEFGLPEACSIPGEAITDTTCWFFELPMAEMLEARARAWNVDQNQVGPPYDLDIAFNFALFRDSPNFGYTFNKLYHTTNLVAGETLSGDVYQLVGYSDTAAITSIQILPLTPTTGTDTKVKSKSACGDANAAWDVTNNNGIGLPGDISEDNVVSNNADDIVGLKKLSVTYTKGDQFGIILEITGQTTQTAPLIELRSKATDSPVFLRGEPLGNCNC